MSPTSCQTAPPRNRRARIVRTLRRILQALKIVPELLRNTYSQICAVSRKWSRRQRLSRLTRLRQHPSAKIQQRRRENSEGQHGDAVGAQYGAKGAARFDAVGVGGLVEVHDLDDSQVVER